MLSAASGSASAAAGSATAAQGSATAAEQAKTAAETARDQAQEAASANAHAVTYDAQTLTAEQQTQARANIGAAGDAEISEAVTQLTEDINGKVGKTGNETINGTKTFGSSPVIPSPTADTHAANKAYVDESMGNVQGCPTGMIAFFHATTPPDGWLPCNGQNVSRTTYANLFAVIGTTYGSGDGSTTFTLPNLHHRFLEGTTTASEVGDYVEAGLPNITGEFSESGDEMKESGCFDSTKYYGGWVDAGNGGMKKTVSFSANRSVSIFGASSYVQPSSCRFLLCIKA